MTARYQGFLTCVRCGERAEEASAYAGCGRCAADGIPANLAPSYDLSAGAPTVDDTQPGLFRHRALLPLAPGDEPVSLGEGRTPLLRLARLSADLGLGQLWLKDESRNPTWSYKDRLAAVAVSKARATGADTVVVATTGNHGAAVAAYAAAAGLRCVALTLTSVPATMRTLMQAYGASVVAFDSPPDRWTVMAAAAEERGWVPMSGFQNPPIGSNAFGVEGYKTISYELLEQLGAAPDVVITPVAYGDGLAGLHRGFAELHALGLVEKVPRLVAAETFGPYAEMLASGGPTPTMPIRPSVAFSIATPWATYQGVDALRRTRGSAVSLSDDEEVMATQLLLGRREGLYLEASSVLPLLAARRLSEEGFIKPDDVVVALGTSTGLKDVDATAARLPAPPVAEPTLAGLDRALEQERAMAGAS
jgi:threonine synthase